MIYYITFLLGSVALTDFIVTSRILKSTREWLTIKHEPLGYLLACHQCVGIYASFFVYLLLSWEIHFIPMIFIGSFLSKLYKKLI